MVFFISCSMSWVLARSYISSIFNHTLFEPFFFIILLLVCFRHYYHLLLKQILQWLLFANYIFMVSFFFVIVENCIFIEIKSSKYYYTKIGWRYILNNRLILLQLSFFSKKKKHLINMFLLTLPITPFMYISKRTEAYGALFMMPITSGGHWTIWNSEKLQSI